MGKSEKFEAIKLLKENGLPVVPFFILEEKDFDKQIIDFLDTYGLKNFIFRTGCNTRKLGTPSIEKADLERDKLVIEKALQNNLEVMIMIYVDIYRNQHNINIMSLDNRVIVEAVGQGFISRDLNIHGHLHEEIIFDSTGSRPIKRKIVNREKYLKSKAKKAKNFDLAELKKNKSPLINKKSYIQLNDDQLNFIRESFPLLCGVARKMKYENFVANFSYADLGNGGPEPVFWDMYEVK